MCMVLARIIRSDGCIYNADTTAQLTAELCLCLGHPELFFDDKVGAPRTRRLEDSEPRFFPTRWSVFRHEKCSSIETLAGYDASKEYTVVESDQNVARWKERYGDENGLPGITYGGHGQPWGHDRSTWGGPKVRSPDMKNGGWQHRSGRLAVLEEEIEVRTASRPREIDWWYSTTKEGAIQARGVPGQLLRVHLAPLTPRHIVPSGSDPTPTPARTCCFKDSVSLTCLQ